MNDKMSGTLTVLFVALSFFILGYAYAFSYGYLPQNPATEYKDGFLMGLLHGATVIPNFILSLFYDSIGIYEYVNAGWTYDLGFIVSAGITASSSSREKE
jgi:hypothetical protein